MLVSLLRTRGPDRELHLGGIHPISSSQVLYWLWILSLRGQHAPDGRGRPSRSCRILADEFPLSPPQLIIAIHAHSIVDELVSSR